MRKCRRVIKVRMRYRIADSGGMSEGSSLRYIRHALDVFNSLGQVLGVAVVRLKARFRIYSGCK